MSVLNVDDVLIRRATNADNERVRELVFGILTEYGLTPDPAGTDRDLEDIETNYWERGGCFEVVEDKQGNLLGTVGLYPLDNETVELRKMYFAKPLRGLGLGKVILRRMIGVSKKKGFGKIHLETAGVLVEAIGLYESFGFRPATEIHSPRCDRAYVLEI